MKRSFWTRSAILGGAIASAWIFGGAPTQPVAQAGGKHVTIPAEAFIQQEPILFYDISGFGFGGPIHQRLAVYNNGLASISATDFTGFGGDATFVYVPIDRARQLHMDLLEAGAFELPDNPWIGNDVPITTVTVFRGTGNDQRAHTYSYYFVDGDEGYSQVALLINAFIAETFPNFFGPIDG